MAADGEVKEPWGDKIKGLKYTLFCFNVISWLLGASLFGLTLWLRMEPGLNEWVVKLDIEEYYMGLYILIVSSAVVMVVAFVGCCSALLEHILALSVFIGTQVVVFILSLAGAAVLLDHSTFDSRLQPLIRNATTRLISDSQNEHSAVILRMIQENVGCCGADGPGDYVTLKKPLPSECRDSVTGNAFFYGCVDELTWLLEDKSGWVGGLAMTLCMIYVINVALTAVLMEAIKREERQGGGEYDHPAQYEKD